MCVYYIQEPGIQILFIYIRNPVKCNKIQNITMVKPLTTLSLSPSLFFSLSLSLSVSLFLSLSLSYSLSISLFLSLSLSLSLSISLSLTHSLFLSLFLSLTALYDESLDVIVLVLELQ